MTTPRRRGGAIARTLRCAVPLLGAVLLAASTATAFAAAAAARQGERQHRLLARALLQHGITRVYTDYWTCGRIAFQTGERIVCAVVDEDLSRGHDRYGPYRPLVAADAGAAWLLPLGTPYAAALAHVLASPCAHRPALVTALRGYLVVRPAGPGPVTASACGGRIVSERSVREPAKQGGERCEQWCCASSGRRSSWSPPRCPTRSQDRARR
jgi:hypothetical protein